MPVLPQEDNSNNITDKAQGATQNAENQGQGIGSKISNTMHSMAHKANPGPVIPDSNTNLGEPASKDELKSRAAELNK